jgi:hypothetical protein
LRKYARAALLPPQGRGGRELGRRRARKNKVEQKEKLKIKNEKEALSVLFHLGSLTLTFLHF